MYPVVNVVVGWLAAAVRGRVRVVVGLMCATTIVAMYFAFVLSFGVPRGRRSDSSWALCVMLLFALAMGLTQASPPPAKFGWPAHAIPPHMLDRQRILGGAILFILAASAGVGLATLVWPNSVVATGWALGLIVGGASVLCAILLVAEFRQRAALQRERKQD